MAIVLPNHTVTINGEGFYAQKCASDNVVAGASVWDDVEIQFGLPRSYGDSQKPRKFTFQSTEINADYMAVTEMIQRCSGILTFSSIFLGTFLAKIEATVAWPDGFDDATYVTFTVEERAG